MGPYRELAADKNGAFAKLMEWQLSGPPTKRVKEEPEGHEELTEEERMRLR